MATRAATGRSSRRDSREAGFEAAREACAGLAGGAPDVLIVFATSGYDAAALLEGVRDAAPDAPISGCSGEGIITRGCSDESERVVAVAAIRSDAIGFRALSVPNYSADPAAAGAELARQVREGAKGDEFALLVFPDGLLGNCTEMLGALSAGLPETVKVVGGTAGDALIFDRTYQYHRDGARHDSIAALVLRGRGRIELAVSHGCTPLGLERHVTRSDGGWVREIDGQPAWSVFRQYLEGEPEDLNSEGAIHLSVGEVAPKSEANEYEAYIIRTPMGLDKNTGSLFFPGGGLTSGGAIRLTRRDPERVRQGARACAERIATRHPDHAPALVVQFDCAGRGKQLFGSQTSEAIVQPLQDVFGPGPAWIGFHTYGEIAPVGGVNYFHNFTVALCAIYEEPERT